MIYELFTQASELPLDEQAAFARLHCTDEKMLTALLSLLSSNQQSNEFTFSAGLSKASEQVLSQHLPAVGDAISVYQLTASLGQGGMGSVFSAKRIDDAFEQQVAIKIIPLHIQAIIKTHSFNNEASLMAKLQHPHIRKVHDAGTLDSGVHYLVMELIDGVKLDEYLKKTSLTIKSRLTLFKKICHAVNHAHQHQVIHADIKPANILVDKNGEPHVLDFGIAKLFDNHNQNVVSYYQAFSTEYASPELIATGQVSTLCDIYSLGKLLEIMLESQSLEKDSFLKYSKELQSIVNLATERTPHKRYSSVLELNNEVNQFLSGHIVSSYQADRLYRVKKFVFNRHPITVTTGLTFVITFSILIANLLNQQLVLKSEKYQTDLMLEKFSLVLDLGSDAQADVQMALANNYESRDEDKKAEALYKKVISNHQLLNNKDNAFNAGSRLIKLLIKTNRFELISTELKALKTKLQFIPNSTLPITASQAMFYHFFVNSTYHRSKNNNERVFKLHTDLMLRIKEHYWHELTNNQKAELFYSMDIKDKSQLTSEVSSLGFYPGFPKTHEKKSIYKLAIDNVIEFKSAVGNILHEKHNRDEKYLPNAQNIINFLESAPIYRATTHKRSFDYEGVNFATFSKGVTKFKENSGIFNVNSNVLTMDFGEGAESDNYLYISKILALSVPPEGDLTVLAHNDFSSGRNNQNWASNELINNDWYHIYDDTTQSRETIRPSLVKIDFNESSASVLKGKAILDVHWSINNDLLVLKSRDKNQALIQFTKVASDDDIIIVKNTDSKLLSFFINNKSQADFIMRSWQELL